MSFSYFKSKIYWIYIVTWFKSLFIRHQESGPTCNLSGHLKFRNTDHGSDVGCDYFSFRSLAPGP